MKLYATGVASARRCECGAKRRLCEPLMDCALSMALDLWRAAACGHRDFSLLTASSQGGRAQALRQPGAHRCPSSGASAGAHRREDALRCAQGGEQRSPASSRTVSVPTFGEQTGCPNAANPEILNRQPVLITASTPGWQAGGAKGIIRPLPVPAWGAVSQPSVGLSSHFDIGARGSHHGRNTALEPRQMPIKLRFTTCPYGCRWSMSRGIP